MASNPLITFKAGKCNFHGKKVSPVPTPGYLYLYIEDDIPHFCWRPRSAPASDPEIDLFMVPGDGSFAPWLKEEGAESLHSPTNGRIYALKFSSSSQKHFFWMQSKTQHREGSLSWFSERDQRLGQIVNGILQGDEVDVEEEMEQLRNDGGGGGDDDDDLMDVDEHSAQGRHGSTGGAGADATGGDPSQEGQASRDGGADGGRAPSSSNQDQSQDPSSVVQNFLRSLQNNPATTNPGQQQQQQLQGSEKPYTTLPDLLPSSTTIPYLSTATDAQLDNLCTFLPPDLFLLAQESASTPTLDTPLNHTPTNITEAAGLAALEALAPHQKREILARVLRSPQLNQSLGSLTVALRDGGLAIVGEALGLKIKNGGNVRHGSVPLGGGEAVEAFVQGVRTTVEEEEEEGKKP